MPRSATKLPENYPALLEDIKSRIRSSQIKAALSVNRELIELYWNIGKSIVERQRKEGWGKSVVERLSKPKSPTTTLFMSPPRDCTRDGTTSCPGWNICFPPF